MTRSPPRKRRRSRSQSIRPKRQTHSQSPTPVGIFDPARQSPERPMHGLSHIPEHEWNNPQYKPIHPDYYAPHELRNWVSFGTEEVAALLTAASIVFGARYAYKRAMSNSTPLRLAIPEPPDSPSPSPSPTPSPSPAPATPSNTSTNNSPITKESDIFKALRKNTRYPFGLDLDWMEPRK